MRFHSCLFFILSAILFIGTSDTNAHPHVSIDNRFRIIFDDEGLSGIRVKWTFDKYFSQMIADEFDADHDGALNPAEVSVIEKEAFSNLANFNYFTFIKVNGDPLKIETVREFNSALKNGVLSYGFTIPLKLKATQAANLIRVSPYDPSYYTLVLFAETNPVEVENKNGFAVEYKIAQNMEESYYDGQVNPYEMVLKYRLAN